PALLKGSPSRSRSQGTAYGLRPELSRSDHGKRWQAGDREGAVDRKPSCLLAPAPPPTLCPAGIAFPSSFPSSPMPCTVISRFMPSMRLCFLLDVGMPGIV
ncbi:hypothetical protein BHE74_00011410, partial [Ensete ventricosum]